MLLTSTRAIRCHSSGLAHADVPLWLVSLQAPTPASLFSLKTLSSMQRLPQGLGGRRQGLEGKPEARRRRRRARKCYERLLSHTCLTLCACGRAWVAAARAWRADLKPGAAAVARKCYERLLLAFERRLAAAAPERPIQNLRSAKAAGKQARPPTRG